MQQRYYDPIAGRFLSVDPVTTDADTGSAFSRYMYASNNPYRFTDPEGRADEEVVRKFTDQPPPPEDCGCKKVTLAPVTIPFRAETVLTQSMVGGFLAMTRLTNMLVLQAVNGEKPSLLDPKGEQHVLDGDGPKKGGGHRAGTGKSVKSEFPANWPDEKILGEISDVATDPGSSRTPGQGGRIIVTGTRDGIDITVVVEGNGRIVTGFPTNVPRNP